jgi:hypothetical protein
MSPLGRGVELHEGIQVRFLDRRFGLIERCHQLLDDRLIVTRSTPGENSTAAAATGVGGRHWAGSGYQPG